MKTTIDLPDGLFTEIKIEAARRRQKLKELVPELLRAGLHAERPGQPAAEAAARWLDEWVKLGHAATRGLPPGATAVDIMTAGRSRHDES